MIAALLLSGVLSAGMPSPPNAPATPSCRSLFSFQREAAVYEIYTNPRFLALLREGLPHYGVPWYRARGRRLILPGGAARAVSSSPGSVTVDSDRFVTITGTFPKEGDSKGLLWCDAAAERPDMIFVYMEQVLGRDNGSRGTLDIYTNRNGTDAPLPPKLIAAILAWKKETGVMTFNSVTLHDAHDHAAALSPSSLSTAMNK
jgi:hypothetical protein